jgi:NAD(P) transhydrogenase subunit alpha
MLIGIPRESGPGEARVAATPTSVKKLVKLGFEVQLEAGAGSRACYGDEAYQTAGAKIVDQSAVWGGSDLILKVLAPNDQELSMIKEGTHLISFVWPAQNEERLKAYAAKKLTVLAMDAVPRISRAQKLDALSSMANISGYKAVIEAANHFGGFFTGQITAAGKMPPAKVLVIGAGVAGLSAIGTAKALGAIVRSFDTRPEVKDQVASMGAEFLELDFKEDGSGQGGYAKVMSKEFIAAEMALFKEQAKEVDIIVTTALIPGRPAPKLILEEALSVMKEGSVVVDLAAEQGGNCEGAKAGEIVTKHGVQIIGYTDFPSRMATQSSGLYANNIAHLLSDMCKGDGYKIDFEDVVVRGMTCVKDGDITFPPPKIEMPAPKAPPKAAPVAQKTVEKKSNTVAMGIYLLIAAGLLGLLGKTAPQEFLAHFTVFVLAVFIGWQVIWNVAPALHTPLMSVTNAISGIIVVGAMLQISGDLSSPVTLLAAAAVLIASINIAGGFLVTQRMLKMFRK